MVRPKKPVDEKLIYSLAKIHCTMEEIAACTGLSHDRLNKRYASLIKNARENGKASLRRYQYLLAKKGNLGMLIWLGKQLLGQREPEELKGPTTIILESRAGQIVAKIPEKKEITHDKTD